MAPPDVLLNHPLSPVRRERACLNCSRAKARCTFQDENVGRYCDRCHRLGTECQAQTTKSLRRPRQVKASTSRVADLESKLDGLVSLLAERAERAVPDQGTGSIPTPESLKHGRASGPEYDPGPSRNLHSNHHYQIPGQAAATSANPAFSLTWEQANLALRAYVTKFLPNFPFVVVDPSTTAEELSLRKPFLFRVVMLVASSVPRSRKKAMKKNVMAYLGQHLLVLEERKLDLLQGLLVFIAWGDIPFYLDRSITHLTHLAVGFAHNLGLVRSPAFFSHCHKLVTNPTAQDASEAMYHRDTRGLQDLQRAHDADEQRAYLGCYYLMSVNSAQFARRNTFKSPYVDMCAACLAQTQESCTDFILEKLVRLQQVVDKVAERFAGDRNADRSQSFAYLINDEMRPLRAQLDKVAESIDQVHPQFPTFWLHYNYVLVRLYEPATYLSDPPLDQGSLYRSQCLLSCLQAARAYFRTLLSLGPDGFIHRAFVSSAELISVLVIASRLLLLDDAEGWDLAAARRTLDFSATLDQLMGQFRAVGEIVRQRSGVASGGDERGEGSPGEEDGEMEMGGARDGEDPFRKYIDKIQFIQAWYNTRLNGASSSFTPTAEELAAYAVDWAAFDGQEHQFWLGLMGNGAWDFNMDGL